MFRAVLFINLLMIYLNFDEPYKLRSEAEYRYLRQWVMLFLRLAGRGISK
jgi:hypothetical protein